MKTQTWWVVDGNFRLLCHSKECVIRWIEYIVMRGGAPKVEAV